MGFWLLPKQLAATLLFLAPLLFPLSEARGATTSWTFLGLCREIIVILGFSPCYLGFIFLSLPRALLLIHLCFLPFRFLLVSLRVLSLSLWAFAFLKHSYTAIVLEFLKGAEVNVCSQSGIFNWKGLFVFAFFKEEKKMC